MGNLNIGASQPQPAHNKGKGGGKGKGKVPCRYGAECGRADCKFGHPEGWVQPAPGPKACRYGVNCKRPDCWFGHPENRANPDPEAWARRNMPACDYGAACRKDGCPFKHDRSGAARPERHRGHGSAGPDPPVSGPCPTIKCEPRLIFTESDAGQSSLSFRNCNPAL